MAWKKKQFCFGQISQVRHHGLGQKLSLFVNQLIGELQNCSPRFQVSVAHIYDSLRENHSSQRSQCLIWIPLKLCLKSQQQINSFFRPLACRSSGEVSIIVNNSAYSCLNSSKLTEIHVVLKILHNHQPSLEKMKIKFLRTKISLVAGWGKRGEVKHALDTFGGQFSKPSFTNYWIRSRNYTFSKQSLLFIANLQIWLILSSFSTHW